MKKLIVLFLLMFAVTILVPSIASADIPPPDGFHNPSLCAKVVNLNAFPNIVLVGYSYGPTGVPKPYEIKNNECLTKGYKFNDFDIYWTTREKFNLMDLDSLSLNSEHQYTLPTDLSLLSKNVETLYFGELIPDSNPLIKGTIEYSITENPISINPSYVAVEEYSLFKSKQISEYNDGTPAKVETFPNPNTVVCTADAKMCPDGSYVGRTGPYCEFVCLDPTPDFNITKTLKLGLKNDNQVKILQNYLNTASGANLVVDGSFGPKTKSATISFQKVNGLVADGIVGKKTVAKMVELLQ